MLVSHFVALREEVKMGKLKHNPSGPQYIEGEETAYQLRNKNLSTITFNYRNNHQFMVAIKSMQTLTKKLKVQCFLNLFLVYTVLYLKNGFIEINVFNFLLDLA